MAAEESKQIAAQEIDRRTTMRTLGLGSLTALATSFMSGGASAQSTFQSQPMSGAAFPSAGQSRAVAGEVIRGDTPLAKLDSTQRQALRQAMLPASSSIESVVLNARALTPAARRLTLRDLDALRNGSMDGMSIGALTTHDLASIGVAFGHDAGNGAAGIPACCCCCCFGCLVCHSGEGGSSK